MVPLVPSFVEGPVHYITLERFKDTEAWERNRPNLVSPVFCIKRILKSSHPQMFYKIVVLRNFAKFT